MADIPPPHQCLVQDNGITKWRAFLEGIRVTPLEAGKVLIEVEIDGVRAARFELTPEQAAHLSNLLSPRGGE
ncbi:hypothetical protein [Parvibaculum sp.]|uniref:hypothetical protein n=1 Tax=Parvibaculum sp. TaxID=2024848 RepID=UPI002734E0DA|nr:hypothetical protein [Parvibaculum sp.]MDP3327720.1 hypothetical protein [Parvibaculum sp.]